MYAAAPHMMSLALIHERLTTKLLQDLRFRQRNLEADTCPATSAHNIVMHAIVDSPGVPAGGTISSMLKQIALLLWLPLVMFAQFPTPEERQRIQELTNADHKQLMEILHIQELRPVRNGSNPQAPNYANYDESKANPLPSLPDPLLLKNGQKVTSSKDWWSRRRPEIVEDFDREIYGRVPKVTPKVTWEVTETVNEKNGDVAVITRRLLGHIDNSSYPHIK